MYLRLLLSLVFALLSPMAAPAQQPRAGTPVDLTQSGPAEALYREGLALRDGTGGLVDLEAAFAKFLEGAKLGHVAAQYEAGLAYEFGFGVAPSFVAANAWYGKAEQRHLGARDRNAALAYLLVTARDKIDQNKKRQLAQRAPDMLEEAFAWVRGLDSQDDHESTAKPNHRYAKRGQAMIEYVAMRGQGDRLYVARAQYLLGLNYKQGRGVDKDTTKAALWFEAAASRGYRLAKLELAVHHLFVRRDKSKARTILEELDSALVWSKDPADQKLRDQVPSLLERAGGISHRTKQEQADDARREEYLARLIEPRNPVCIGPPCRDLRFGSKDRNCMTLSNPTDKPVAASIMLQLGRQLEMRIEPAARETLGTMRFIRRADGTVEPTYDCAEELFDVVTIDAAFAPSASAGRPEQVSGPQPAACSWIVERGDRFRSVARLLPPPGSGTVSTGEGAVKRIASAELAVEQDKSGRQVVLRIQQRMEPPIQVLPMRATVKIVVNGQEVRRTEIEGREDLRIADAFGGKNPELSHARSLEIALTFDGKEHKLIDCQLMGTGGALWQLQQATSSGAVTGKK